LLIVLASFIPYDETVHGKELFELNVEYMTYLREAGKKSGFGHSHSVLDHPREYIESTFHELSTIKPSEGIVYILEVDGKVAGMGALRKLEEGVGEIKRMYNRPEYQGKGYGKQMVAKLLDKARELGYHTVRLDTANFLEAAIHVYKAAGFKEREKYPGTESAGDSYSIYMEKKL